MHFFISLSPVKEWLLLTGFKLKKGLGLSEKNLANYEHLVCGKVCGKQS